MKKIPLILSFFLFLALFSSLFNAKGIADNEIRVGVFYYPWYCGANHVGHWNGHPRDYGINLSDTWWRVIDPPVLGWYASDNRTVIDQHLDWFACAGIDFGIISWWGPYVNKTVFDDKWTEVLLNETRKYAPWFKWVVSIEGGDPREWESLRDWVYENYTKEYPEIWLSDPEKNKPFLFWMNSDITNDSHTRDLIKEDNDFSVRILGQASYSDWKTWTPYSYGNATSPFPPSMSNYEFMCVMPRYDETMLDPNRSLCADKCLNGSGWDIIEPLSEPLYDYQWKEVSANALVGNIKYVCIATWNDFTERTHIEPCYDNTSAYSSDPFYLLNRTKHYINQLKSLATLQNTLDTLDMSYASLSSRYDNMQLNYLSLLSAYNDLLSKYDALDSSYANMQGDYNTLNSSYSTLNSTCNDLNVTLKDYQQTVQNELTNIKNTLYVLVVITAILATALAYTATKKLKTRM